jgi:hypothetical protein
MGGDEAQASSLEIVVGADNIICVHVTPCVADLPNVFLG